MSIGETLRSARERAGLSVGDIIHATQMTRAQVEGLESNDYHAFSAPVYTKGFIKLFARAVGLAPEPLVKEYLANPNGTEQHDPSREIPVVALETINPENGALVSVRPPLPHAAPPHEAAPAGEKKVASAEPVAAETAPAPAEPVPAAEPAPAAEHETTLLDFMTAPEPAAEPAEKRLAPVEPGVVPPEPPLKLVRFDDPAPKPAPAPVAKTQPEPDAVGAPSRVRSAALPVAPAPVELAAAPFVFPGARHAPAAAKPPAAATPAADAAGADELVAPRPAKPARTAELFPDESLAPAPDAPNAVKLFFANLGDAFRRFGGRIARAAERVRARAAAAAPRARRAWPVAAGVAGAVVFAVLLVALFSGGGETTAAPDAPVDEAFFPPEPDEGPVEIVPVLPAPRSFAK